MNKPEKNLLKLTVGSFVVGLALSRQYSQIRALKTKLHVEEFKVDEALRLLKRAVVKMDEKSLAEFSEELEQDVAFTEIIMNS